ncbi:MAG: hypothetical protein Q8920_04560 [Bacillota bacterium]|nr:hypothetical protein [Bacillota bacterium]
MLDIKKLLTDAVDFCSSANRTDLISENKSGLLKSQDRIVHSKFRYSIARDIASYIILNYGYIVKNIKLYGSTMEYNAGKYSDIDLIIHVESMGREIREDIKSIDKLLVEGYYSMIEENDSPEYLMDVQIIDDGDSNINPSAAYLKYIMMNDSVLVM